MASHDEIVADYRRHGSNLSGRPERMLSATLRVLRTQRRGIRDATERAAYARGLAVWRDAYGGPLIWLVAGQARRHEWREALRALAVLLRYDPGGALAALLRRAVTGRSTS